MNLPLFLSKRIYKDNNQGQEVSRPAIKIAMAGVAIGLAVMLVSVGVVMGFKHTIRDKIVGFGSHVQVASFLSIVAGEENPVAFSDSLMQVIKTSEGVEQVQIYANTQGILKTDNNFLGVAFKGVEENYDTTFLHNSLKEGYIPTFSATKSSNRILISQAMADKLDVKAGQRIFAYFISNSGVRTRRFTIAGIYETNLAQFDNKVCFCDRYTASKINGWEQDQVSGAEVKLSDFSRLDELSLILLNKVKTVTDKYGVAFSAKDIRSLNPAIFSWLDLLDINIWIILALMIAVAGVTMISGLLIIILERTTTIGILKALGARNSAIRHTFIWFAVFVIGKGLVWGNIIGLGLMLLQKFTGFVKLDPATYYVSTVPVEFDLIWILSLNVVTMLVCVLVLLVPSLLVSHIDPAKSMRYE